MKSRLKLVLGLIACGSSAQIAEALTISSIASDVAWVAESGANGWAKQWGANARWGNNANNGDWEVSVVDGGDFPQDSTNSVQHVHNASGETFTISYDAGLQKATLKVGGSPTAMWSPIPLPGSIYNTVYLRAATKTNTIAEMTNMMLTFGGGGPIALPDLIGDGDAQYLKLVDPLFNGDWTLTGTGKIANVGGSPSGSRPMYQAKVGYTSVPDSGSLLGVVSCALAGLALVRRRLKA